MAARALGALLSFVAASLFAVSIVSPKVWPEGPGWWDGHPTVAGQEIERKDTHIGLVGAVGCDSRGCQNIEVDSTYKSVALVELSAILLALVLAGAMGAATMKASDRKKTIAGLSIGSTGVVAIGAVALLVVGVDVKSTEVVTVPIGPGMFLFWGGVAASAVASMIVLTERPEPLRLKPHLPPPPDAIHPPPVDVSEILRPHDRPSALVLAGAPGLGPPTADGVEQLRVSHAHMHMPPEHSPLALAMTMPAAGHTGGDVGVPGSMTRGPSPIPPTPIPPTPRAIAGELVTRPDAPRTAVIAAVPPPVRPKSTSVAPPPGTDPGAAPRHSADPLMMRPPILNSRVDPVADTVPAKPPSVEPAAFAHTEVAVGRGPAPARAGHAQMAEPVDTERELVAKEPLTTPVAVRPGATLTSPPPPTSRPRVPMPTPIGRAPPGNPVPMPRSGRPTPFGGDRPIATPHKVDPDPAIEPPTITSPPPIVELPAISGLPPPKVVKPTRLVTDTDDRLGSSLRETDLITAVEIDVEAKSRAQGARTAAAEAEADVHRREVEARRLLEGGDGAGERSLVSLPIIKLDTDQQARLAADLATRPASDPGTSEPPARAPESDEQPTIAARTKPDDVELRPTVASPAVILPSQLADDDEHNRPTKIAPAVVLPRANAGAVATPPRPDPEGLAPTRAVVPPIRATPPTAPPPRPAGAIAAPSRPDSEGDVMTALAAPALRVPGRGPSAEDARPTRLAPAMSPPMRPSPLPLSTAPATLPPPKKSPTSSSGPTPACPQCEAPMSWVEEHLRFYCKQCRMYF